MYNSRTYFKLTLFLNILEIGIVYIGILELKFWNYILNILTEMNEIPENWQLSSPPGLYWKLRDKKANNKKAHYNSLIVSLI